MTSLKERVASLKKEMQGWTKGVYSCNSGCNELALDDMKKALEIIQKQQEITKMLELELINLAEDLEMPKKFTGKIMGILDKLDKLYEK